MLIDVRNSIIDDVKIQKDDRTNEDTRVHGVGEDVHRSMIVDRDVTHAYAVARKGLGERRVRESDDERCETIRYDMMSEGVWGL